MHGFLSRDQTSPADLLELGAKDLARYDTAVVTGTVRRLRREGSGDFRVELDIGEAVTARAVVLATGLRDELPAVPGLPERWGRTVLHCPYCHGWEVRDAPLAVLGGLNRPFTLHQVQLVRQWSDTVVFAPNDITLDDEERTRITARGIEIVDGPVTAMTDNPDGPVALEFADGRVLPRAAVFVGPNFVPHDDLLTELDSARDTTGTLTVDPTGATSTPGAWAAGNVVRDTQAIVSAASGVTAGIAVNHYLLAQDVERAVSAATRPPDSTSLR